MSMLDRKLGRDLWRVRGQALAIMLVISLGVMLLVMMDGLVNSLSETRHSYYQRYRLAEIFAPVKRAQRRLLTEVAALPGVAVVEGRINGGALLNLPGVAAPIRARMLSLPTRLNQLVLSAGRLPNPGRRHEVLLLNGFARARGLAPGDTLLATMNGGRQRLTIAGLAQAPEFVYTTAPGELVPDDGRFAVIWMQESVLAAAFDLEGAVNEILLTRTRGAREAGLIAALDRLLAPYGALGAYGLADQLSNRFVEEEIAGLRVSSRVVPPVFLGVAAFLLYMVLSRMVQAEREQIGLLKAFGHSGREVAVHYLKFVLVIALGGALAGSVMGVLAGRALSGFYQLYYQFPFLLFRLDPAALVIGVSVSMLAASAGALLVLRRVLALAPATAMRPPSPPDFSHGLRLGPRLGRWLDQPSRMVLRNLWRRPVRALLTVLGIALGMALPVAMLSVMNGFDRALALTFNDIDRSDVTVSFVEPRGSKSLFALAQLDGVLALEPFRSVPVILRHDRYQYRGAITALMDEPRLYRALDKDRQPLVLRAEGVILARALAQKLSIAPGEMLSVEVREGRRPVLAIPVVGLADTLLGAPAFMQLDALNRVMGEPGRVSGAYLRIDTARSAALYREMKEMPVVAGVSLRQERREAFRKVMDSGAGATRYLMAAIAGVITFGIVYNGARIAFAERARELAGLRIMGLTRAEVGFVLLGELGLLTLLALPLGSLLGYGLSLAVAAGFSTELYQVPVELAPVSHGQAVLAVLAAALLSGIGVQRDIHRLDLVAALNIRE